MSKEQGDASATALIRLRLGPTDVRYAGDLVAGATAVAIFGDLETELAIRVFGDEGLCVAYESIEFTAPLRVGDYVEGRGAITAAGRTSRRTQLELYKVIETDAEGNGTILDPPVLAARAEATIVSARRENRGR